MAAAKLKTPWVDVSVAVPKTTAPLETVTSLPVSAEMTKLMLLSSMAQSVITDLAGAVASMVMALAAEVALLPAASLDTAVML